MELQGVSGKSQMVGKGGSVYFGGVFGGTEGRVGTDDIYDKDVVIL